MNCYRTWPLELARAGLCVGGWGICMIEQAEDAGAFVTGAEHAVAARFGSRLRRLEWLGARAGLRRMLRDAGVAPVPGECRIEKDRYGKPVVRIDSADGARPVNGSLTHKEGLAGFCAAWEGGVRVGIDFETVTRKAWLLQSAFATRSDSLVDLPGELSYYSVLWSCKEAASKALGEGLLVDFRRLVIGGTTAGRFTVSGDEVAPMEGRYYLMDDMVAAVVLMESPDPGSG